MLRLRRLRRRRVAAESPWCRLRRHRGDGREHRELYHENRARWLESLACRIQTPIRVAMLPQGGPYIDIVGQFCNQSQNCLVDLAMVFTLTAAPSAAGVVVVCASTRIWTNDGASPYTMGGTFPDLGLLG